MKAYNIDLTSYDVGNVREYEHFYGVSTTISVRGDYRNVKINGLFRRTKMLLKY